jgi:hypothetical protein
MPNGPGVLGGEPTGEAPTRQSEAEGAIFGTARGGAEASAADLPDAEVDLRSREEWRLACRVAASKRLRRSDLLPRFLLYVCEQHLMGKTHEITEQRIGTHIFNRASDYNPGEDNIVRSYARTLRKRLDEYFEDEGSKAPIRITIPRGGYVPSFHRWYEPEFGRAEVEAMAQEDDPAPSPEGIVAVASEPRYKGQLDRQLRRSRRLSWALGLVAVLLLVWVVRLEMHSTHTEQTREVAHVVWIQLFQNNRDTLIVPADSGLGILQNLTGHLVGLGEYANRTYLSEVKPPSGMNLNNFNDLRGQHYTSIVDLNITAMLIQLPEFNPGRSQVRYTRSLTIEDVKNSNVILLGSAHTNPWVSLFDDKLNFKLEYTPEVDQSFVVNEHPIGTEQPKYRNGTAGTVNRTYGAIDYLPNLDGIGHVLIIQGLNMAATQAAADTLFNSQKIEPFLKRATLSNGSLRSFELLVETSSIDATAPGSEIIASRFYPQ